MPHSTPRKNRKNKGAEPSLTIGDYLNHYKGIGKKTKPTYRQWGGVQDITLPEQDSKKLAQTQYSPYRRDSPEDKKQIWEAIRRGAAAAAAAAQAEAAAARERADSARKIGDGKASSNLLGSENDIFSTDNKQNINEFNRNIKQLETQMQQISNPASNPTPSPNIISISNQQRVYDTKNKRSGTVGKRKPQKQKRPPTTFFSSFLMPKPRPLGSAGTSKVSSSERNPPNPTKSR